MTTKTKSKDDFKIVRKRVSSLKPSPENSLLYRAIPDDPDIDGLVESIRKEGLHQPLVVTLDNYIVSGHRRRTALLRIGPKIAPCRVLPIVGASLTTEERVALLREQADHVKYIKQVVFTDHRDYWPLRCVACTTRS